jgi:hypothetical protein
MTDDIELDGYRVYYEAAGCTFYRYLEDAERLCKKLRDEGEPYKLMAVYRRYEERYVDHF